ncbi:MAG: 3-methyl-2-oxobutanoate hydroxymethyltransferase [Sphaerospermopsis sp. SIO1G2]|nr:3-methyl-2-oxobutanoate hydroxymethyltransferase [Sphaerospermopsis sp. SIO1G2]
MSSTASPTHHRTTIRDITALKGDRPIVALTAYTYGQALLLDAHVDLILVGDSLGMVLYGMESTLPVTLEDMIRHGECVVRGSQRACIIVDMPFGSYQASAEHAYRHAADIMKRTGAQAVKMEGGAELADTVHFLTERGIPVMGHIGLKPQHVHMMGGYRYQGRDAEEQRAIHQDAQALTQAGVFALVLEAMDADLAANITQSVAAPTIGIGAGPGCDGQILVTDDMLGLSEHTAKFVQSFADMRTLTTRAVRDYADAVTARHFPSAAHCYGNAQHTPEK